MTDEERQKLCDKLRYPLKEWSAKKLWDEACLPAADEIERLATENEKLKEQRAAWEQTSRVALAEIERLAERVKNLEGRLEAVQRM